MTSQFLEASFPVRISHLSGFLWSCCLALSAPSHAADVGGWYADQQKAATQAAATAAASGCPQALARATAEATALNTYQVAHCYLQGDNPDLVAARAWLARSAEMNFMPAHRMLRALMMAEAGVHASQRHCHDLGEGRQICHGGGAPPVGSTN